MNNICRKVIGVGWRKTIQQRLAAIAQEFPGNIIEIGAGNGDTTVEFLKVQQDREFGVLVVDPFESGWDEMPDSYGKPYPYEKFKEETDEYVKGKNLGVLQLSSQDQVAKLHIESTPLVSLIFIDGLQYKDAVLSDLRTAIKCRPLIICVDDFNRSTGVSQVPEAVEVFKKETDYIFLYTGIRECYFVRP